MVIVLWTPEKRFSTSTRTPEGVIVKFMHVLRRLVRRKPTHRHDPSCESECEKQQDERMHELANRLHVLEYEAYGDAAFTRRKRKQT